MEVESNLSKNLPNSGLKRGSQRLKKPPSFISDEMNSNITKPEPKTSTTTTPIKKEKKKKKIKKTESVLNATEQSSNGITDSDDSQQRTNESRPKKKSPKKENNDKSKEETDEEWVGMVFQEEISESDVKDSIYLAQTQFFFDMKPHFVYHTLISLLMDLTKSPYGYMGELYHDGKSWRVNGVTSKKGRPESFRNSLLESKINFKLGTDTLCGFAIKTKQTITSNSPNTDLRAKSIGLPKEHPKITSLLSIPIFSGNKENFLAIAVVFNRPKGYTIQHVKAIQPFLKTMENLLEAYGNRQLIKQHEVNEGITERARSISFQISGSRRNLDSSNSFLKEANRARSISFMGDKRTSYSSPEYSSNSSPESDANFSTHSAPSSPSPPRRKISFGSRLELSLAKFFRSNKNPKQDYFQVLKQYAEQKDHRSLRKLLKEKKYVHLNEKDPQDGRTLLHIAIENNDYESVLVLLEANADTSVKDHRGYTPLHSAGEYAGQGKILTRLLDMPFIDPNAYSNLGSTPFHHFCQHFSSPEFKELFKLFLERGADVNIRDKSNGETPLHKAILNRSVKLMMVELLLEHKAEINLSNHAGDTPLHYAVRMDRQDLVRTLILNRADLFLKNNQEKTALDISKEVSRQNEDTTELLQKTQELFLWAREIGMKKYVPYFIKESLFKDVLYLVDDKVLIDIGISLVGDRIKILHACNDLKVKKALAKVNQNTGSTTTSQQTPSETSSSSEDNRHLITVTPPQNQQIHPTPSGRQRPIRRRVVKIVPDVLTKDSEDNLSAQEQEEKIKENLRANLSDSSWIKYSDLEFTKQLNIGSSGQVYKGFYRGTEVAIKVLEPQESTEIFQHEFKVLSSARGPKIVSFYGACLQPRLCLVMEYCVHGSLYDVLIDQSTHFGWMEMIGFAIQMAQGIRSLHHYEPQILHRDIKSMNFLVDENWCVKVCDFGLARFQSPAYLSTLSKLRGTMIYCSPETCKGEQYTAKSDIYSMGICFWEMINRCITGEYSSPFAEYDVSSSLQVILQTPKGLRPTIPESCPKILASVIKSCWDNNPDNRPDVKELLNMLKQCSEDFKNNFELWDKSQKQKRPLNYSPVGTPVGTLRGFA